MVALSRKEDLALSNKTVSILALNQELVHLVCRLQPTVEYIVEYLSGRLPEADAMRFQTHLSIGCPTCWHVFETGMHLSVDNLISHLYGRLDAETEQRVIKHLEVCSYCTSTMEMVRSVEQRNTSETL